MNSIAMHNFKYKYPETFLKIPIFLMDGNSIQVEINETMRSTEVTELVCK
jgi:hypothetical protein